MTNKTSARNTDGRATLMCKYGPSAISYHTQSALGQKAEIHPEHCRVIIHEDSLLRTHNNRNI